MWIWALLFIYTLISASGLIMIKTGASGASISAQNGFFSLQVPPKMLIGFLLYVLSFLLSVFVMSRMKLSVYYPVSTGVVLTITCIFSYFFLKEKISTTEILGIALILAGVIVMNIKR
jgi:multidrug transporter EmrE-like cation transporter